LAARHAAGVRPVQRRKARSKFDGSP
jgi:hypothetical protein